MKKSINTLSALTLLIIFLIQGCDYSDMKQKSVIGNATIEVDENYEPLMNELKSDFERLNPEGKLEVLSNPTKVVANDFVNRKVTSIIIPRELSQDEIDFAKQVKLEFKKFDIATDAIGFVVNPKNPVERLTSEDLRKIFTGEYTKWTDIKLDDPNKDQNDNVEKKMTGLAQKIKVFIQRPNEFTYDFVKDSIMKGTEYSRNAIPCFNSADILDSVRKNINSIGITNLSWVSTSNQDVQDSTVKPVRISLVKSNGIQKDFSIFHQGTAAYGTYPYTRKVYFYTSNADITLVTGFITYLLGNDGQKVVLKNNLGPLKQPIRYIKIE